MRTNLTAIRASAFGSALALLAAVTAAGFAAVPQGTHAQAVAKPDAGLPVRAADIDLAGTITGKDNQTYVRAPFTVPAGVDRLVIAVEHDGRDVKTVMDLGLDDPNGFRGASGGNKSHFTLSATDATPSYLPGPIVPGEWALAFAIPNIRPGVTSHWKARIWLLKGAEAQMLPSPHRRARAGLVSRRYAHAHRA